MAAKVYYSPFIPAFNSNGAPVPGATLTFYYTGTTTPAPIYSDAGLSVALSNPVPSNAAGKYPAIYLDDTVTYRVVQKDADGSQLGDAIDPYIPGTALKGDPGDPGPAGNVAGSLAQLKAAETSNEAMIYDRSLAIWSEGDFSTIADDVIFVESNNAPSSTGVWWREMRDLMDWIPSTARLGAMLGTVDVASYLRTAIAEVGVLGGVLRIPQGDFQLSSTVLGSSGITIPSNVHIIGEGKNKSRFTITGTTECNLFDNPGNSNISIESCGFYGNSVANASGTGAFIRNVLSAAATSNMTDIVIRDCAFENFKADNWIETYGENTTCYISRVIIDNNLVTSQPGNARDGTSTGVPSAFASFSAGNTTCKIYDCRFSNNIVYGDYIKSACLTWAGVNRFVCEGNEAINMSSDASISNDSSAYAFLSYNGFATTNRPSEIVYRNNRVLGCKDAGIYATDITHLVIDGFECANQTSTADTTLPKGAIVLNATKKAFVANVRLSGSCARGLAVSSGEGSEEWIFRNIDLGDTAALGFRFGGVGVATLLDIDGFRCQATSNRAMFLQPTDTSGITRLKLRNFDIKAPSSWAFEVSPTGAVTFALWEIANGRCGDGGIRIPSIASTTSVVSLSDIIFEDTGRAQGFSLVLTDTKKVMLKNLTFVGDIPSQHLSLQGTEGNAYGLTFVNAPSAKHYSGTSTLCVSAPTWTGDVGDFVQNVNTTTALEQGAATTKYVLTGWRWQTGTTWTEVRAPTNNNTATA